MDALLAHVDDASTLSHLEGSRSGARYRADRLARLDTADGSPLLARYDLAAAARRLTPERLSARGGGMWRWAELLPVRRAANVVHLGEGDTPLLPVPALARALGLDRLLVKVESVGPTGSFKARGMAAAVAAARERGARSFVVPSAGNAAGALAAYGARAGLPVCVLMPADAPAANREEALVCGARVLLVDGLIDDCGRLAGLLAEQIGAFDVATLTEPYRVEGKKTMGLELAEALGAAAGRRRRVPGLRRGASPPWRLPDVVVYPTGGGTGLIGMWKGFDELEALGLVGAARPRMVAVQAAGCAPIVRAHEAGQRRAAPWPDGRTRASGLRVPTALGDFLILEALAASRGRAVAVAEDDIDAYQRLAGRLGAGYVAPETAAAFAAVADLRQRDWLDPAELVVVFDTGVGHKYPPPRGLPLAPVIPADETDPERLAAAAEATG